MTTSYESKTKGTTLRAAMQQAVRDGIEALTAAQWADAYGVSRSRAYELARDVGLQFARPGNVNFPPQIRITYGVGKRGPRPYASVPCTAIRAAGLDGHRTMKIAVDPVLHHITLTPDAEQKQ